MQDARRHGVEVRPPDVLFSEVESTLEDLPHAPAARIGLLLIAGLKAETAERIVAARRQRPFANAEDLANSLQLVGAGKHRTKLTVDTNRAFAVLARTNAVIFEEAIAFLSTTIPIGSRCR